MNNKILVKNILLFVFPLLIPVFILGTFAIIITDKYMRESIQVNQFNVLQQLEQQTNTILNEMYLLNLDYNWNPEIILDLQNFFDADYYTYEQVKDSSYQEGNIRRKEIATPYIQSIYVYYSNNYDRVLTSRDGIIPIDKMSDDSWFEEYNPYSTRKEIWMKNRDILDYSFTKSESVISVFLNVFKTNSNTSEGLIVLNLYESYFSDLIKELNNYHNQNILVLDDQNNRLYGSQSSEHVDLKQLDLNNEKPNYEIKLDGTTYIVQQLISDSHSLRYFALAEKNDIYLIPNQLRLLTVLFVIVSLALGTATIYYLSRRNARHVSNIISILNLTDKGQKELIRDISFKDNEYQLIVQRVLRNFITKNNMEKELSEQKYQLQSAELLALQNQVNPHFLSNTLAIIYWRAMALTGKPNKVTQMLETLTDILNYSLRMKHHTVALKDEVHHTKNYLDIIRIRSDQPFTVKWDYDDSILDEQVLKFVLQPIVENSLTHGMDMENEEKHITIKVKIRKLDNKLRITVIDNGKGIAREKLKKLREELDKEEYTTNHIGLANTKKRLSLIFNEQYTFIIRSKEDWGTVVFIEHSIK